MRWFFAFLVIFLIGCVQQQTNEVTIGTTVISVEVANTFEERQQGLMFRESLAENKGMFFVFDTVGKHSFWMKNTLIPLDMIFISEDLIIVDILQAEPCVGDPCKRYTPRAEVKYVLEVNKGYASTHNIQRGDRVTKHF